MKGLYSCTGILSLCKASGFQYSRFWRWFEVRLRFQVKVLSINFSMGEAALPEIPDLGDCREWKVYLILNLNGLQQ